MELICDVYLKTVSREEKDSFKNNPSWYLNGCTTLDIYLNKADLDKTEFADCYEKINWDKNFVVVMKQYWKVKASIDRFDLIANRVLAFHKETKENIFKLTTKGKYVRKIEILIVRYLIIYFCYEYGKAFYEVKKFGYTAVGNYFEKYGRKIDHATVINAIKVIDNFIATDSNFKEMYIKLKQFIDKKDDK